MAHGHRLRKGRVSLPNQIYTITIVTHERAPIFEDFYHARAAIRVLRNFHEQELFHCQCFVVMPDHIHALIQLGETRTLSSVIQQFKSLTTKSIGHPIWQKGFHDRALRKEEDVIDIARYIVANPLRAGLVKSLKDYPHWDSIWI